MTTYSVTCKIIRGAQGDIETLIEDYINSVTDSKTIRSVTAVRYGNDQVIVTIIHDA